MLKSQFQSNAHFMNYEIIDLCIIYMCNTMLIIKKVNN